MSKNKLEVWLGGRTPAIPTSFLPFLRGSELRSPDSRTLGSLGVAALARALEGPSGLRDSAYSLLAADAFLTYACEAAAGEPDTQAALEDLLQRMGEDFR